MEENSKLFVFEKKEVILIFIFIVMMAAITFTLGVKTGKELSLKKDEYTNSDVARIELKSEAEEDAAKVEPIENTIADQQKEIEERLRKEMEKLAEGVKPKVPIVGLPEVEGTKTPEPKDISQPRESSNSEIRDIYNQEKNYQGKFTIQLYSTQSEETAKDFADAFIVKGYDVIINQVDIAGKGTWYRVSIGAFKTTDDARAYLQQEKALFRGTSYIIQNL